MIVRQGYATLSPLIKSKDFNSAFVLKRAKKIPFCLETGLWIDFEWLRRDLVASHTPHIRSRMRIWLFLFWLISYNALRGQEHGGN